MARPATDSSRPATASQLHDQLLCPLCCLEGTLEFLASELEQLSVDIYPDVLEAWQRHKLDSLACSAYAARYTAIFALTQLDALGEN